MEAVRLRPEEEVPDHRPRLPRPAAGGRDAHVLGVQHEQQLAQLGFIVIQVGHRGGTPTRSKAYHSYGYFNLRDYGLADKKTAIEQLAARHPWIDIERVGIYGHSGGGFMSAAALLQKPYNEFFKVAVASAGNHDNNIYNNTWAERYHGLKEVPRAKPRTRRTARRRFRRQAVDDEGDPARQGRSQERTTKSGREEGRGQEGPTPRSAETKKAEAKKDDAKKDEAKKAEEKKDDRKTKKDD